MYQGRISCRVFALDFALLTCDLGLFIINKKHSNKQKTTVAFAEASDFSGWKQIPSNKEVYLIESICKLLAKNITSVADAFLIMLAPSDPKLVFLFFKTWSVVSRSNSFYSDTMEHHLAPSQYKDESSFLTSTWFCLAWWINIVNHQGRVWGILWFCFWFWFWFWGFFWGCFVGRVFGWFFFVCVFFLAWG